MRNAFPRVTARRKDYGLFRKDGRKGRCQKSLDWRTLAIVFGVLGAMIALCLIISAVGNAGVKKQEQELQAIVDQIMIDIENEDFVDAYVKANSLYWEDNWTSEGEDKWDATRKEIIKQIEEVEKKATGSTTNSSDEDEDDGSGFWDWFG